MALEDLTGNKFLNSLNSSNPDGSTDEVKSLDDHIRGIKNVLKKTFPNVSGEIEATHDEIDIIAGATLSTDELNTLDGITATTAELNKLDADSGIAIDSDNNISQHGQKVVEKTADFTLSVSEKGQTIECNKATPFTVTVPTQSNVDIAIGYTVTLVQMASQVTVGTQTGVTVNTAGGLSILRRYDAVSLYKRATDEWMLLGNTE